MTMLQDADGGKDRFLLWSAAIAFFMIGSFGVWTIYVWIALWNDWSFADLRQFSLFVILPIAILVPICRRAAARIVVHPSARQPDRMPAATLAATTGVAAGTRDTNLRWLLFSLLFLVVSLALAAIEVEGTIAWQWLLFSAACALLVFVHPGVVNMGFDVTDHRRRPSGALYRAFVGGNDAVWYLSMAALLVMAYAFSTHTGSDDTHFLGAAVSLLKYPDAPLFVYDVIFGEEGIPNYIYALNRGQSLEALAAVLSSVLNADHLMLYYWWIPLAFLLLAPIPIVLFVRPYYPDFAWIGVAFALLFLLAWSSDNWHAGQFFVPKLWQGKAFLVTLIVPAIFLTVRELVRRGSTSLSIVIMLLFVAGAGFSSTGLYIGPVAAGIAFLTFVPLDRRKIAWSAAVLIVAALPNILMLLDTYHGISNIHEVRNAVWQDTPRPPRDPGDPGPYSLYTQFGGGKNLAAAMLLMWFAMVFASLQRALRPNLSDVVKFILLVVLIAFSRPLSQALADLAGIGNLNWRWHWTMPMGVILALTAAGGIQFAVSSIPALMSHRIQSPLRPFVTGALRISAVVIPILALLGLLAVNASHLSTKYALEVRTVKIHPDQLFILDHFRGRDLSGKLMLVDERIGRVLSRIVHEGRVIAAGRQYWSHPYFSSDEIWARYKLGRIIRAHEPPDEQGAEFLRREIRSRGINLLLFDRSFKAVGRLSELAQEEGMTCDAVGVWQLCEAD